MTQIMHDIIVVALSDTSAWKKKSPDPTPQFPKLADLHCILSISLCNGAETSKSYVLTFVPVWGCFLLDFSYDFMNIVIFPPPEKKRSPTCTPYPTEGSKSSQSVEKCSKIVCCQLLDGFMGWGGASQASGFFSGMELYQQNTNPIDSASQVGPKLEQMPKREKVLSNPGIPCSRSVPPAAPDWISDFRFGSILLTIWSRILWISLLYRSRYILIKIAENQSQRKLWVLTITL